MGHDAVPETRATGANEYTRDDDSTRFILSTNQRRVGIMDHIRVAVQKLAKVCPRLGQQESQK